MRNSVPELREFRPPSFLFTRFSWLPVKTKMSIGESVMSPAHQLAKGATYMIISGFLAKGSGAVIFGLCAPTTKLCSKFEPSFWMYMVFGASLFLLFSGGVHFLSGVLRARAAIKAVYRKNAGPKDSPVTKGVLAREPEIVTRFLPHRFDSDFRALLGEGRYDSARTLLNQFEPDLDPRILKLVQDTSQLNVRVDGWEAANQFIAEAENQHGQLTAIGIDISEHNGYEQHSEPAIELNLFDDTQFSFSTHAIAAIATEANFSNGPHWQGCFLEICSESLQLSGLAGLHHAISFELGNALTNDNAKVAECWRRLLFEEAVVLALKSGALRLKVPVIIGTHDLAPFMATVVNSA
jgi:hypothetical protein